MYKSCSGRSNEQDLRPALRSGDKARQVIAARNLLQSDGDTQNCQTAHTPTERDEPPGSSPNSRACASFQHNLSILNVTRRAVDGIDAEDSRTPSPQMLRDIRGNQSHPASRCGGGLRCAVDSGWRWSLFRAQISHVTRNDLQDALANLDGNDSITAGVTGFVEFTHSARTCSGEDFVRAEFCACESAMAANQLSLH